jgi:hypothetical protein
MNKEKYDSLMENYAYHCMDSMDMQDMMDYVYQGMLVRFEDMPKHNLLEEIGEFAPHLLEEEA